MVQLIEDYSKAVVIIRNLTTSINIPRSVILS